MKEMNCSSTRELDDLVGEIDTKSQLTFENLNSQVKSHSSTQENVSAILLYIYKLNGFFVFCIIYNLFQLFCSASMEF